MGARLPGGAARKTRRRRMAFQAGALPLLIKSRSCFPNKKIFAIPLRLIKPINMHTERGEIIGKCIPVNLRLMRLVKHAHLSAFQGLSTEADFLWLSGFVGREQIKF